MAALILFGGGGDLALRMLLPSLYFLDHDGLLPPELKIIGAARSQETAEDYIAKVRQAVQPRAEAADAWDETSWARLTRRLEYLAVDATDAESLRAVKALTSDGPITSFLAVSPSLYGRIVTAMKTAGLAGPDDRIVLEKPVGRDLESFRAIDDAVAHAFDESQVFRIDHYLGKEPVQNLLALRFANRLFEPLWCAAQIRAVEITIAEELGVEKRGEFYDQTGALRDMLQNHLLQLLCFTAMEPPLSLGDSDVRNAKLNVLRALKPFNAYSVRADVVRGQYTAGQIRGENVCGYREEANVAPQSRTETFIALRAEIDNPRWRGVPFLLRSGKRMAGRLAEIVLHFWPEAHPVFGCGGSPNRISVRLQPQESVKLFLQMKAPGTSLCVHEAALDLDLLKIFPERRADAYERLLLDAIDGKLALFMRSDELEAAWRWLQPVLDDWAARQPEPQPYPAGSHAPEAAIEMAAACGVDWRNR